MVGDNIRLRRKRLKISQQDLAKGDWTRSYISQIERSRIKPSLETLTKIATKLDTTVGELVGDQLTLQKAKAAILHPDICKKYLKQLPKTTTTIFLDRLTNSLQTNKTLECQIPPNAELYYLTARVHFFQKNYPQAIQVLETGLRLFDKYWGLLYLTRLYKIYDLIDDVEQLEAIKGQLARRYGEICNKPDLLSELANELRYESDSIRSLHLSLFIQSIDYGQDFSYALNLLKSL